MSTNINEMRYRLIVQQAEDRQLNQLIPKIRSLLDACFEKSNASSSDRDKWKLQSKQFSNLLGVSEETDSSEVVIGFIEYQIGRDNHKKNWAWENFGERLKKELRALKDPAKGIVGQAITDSGYILSTETARPQEEQRVWMDLVRLYAGHMRRYFIYLEKRP